VVPLPLIGTECRIVYLELRHHATVASRG